MSTDEKEPLLGQRSSGTARSINTASPEFGRDSVRMNSLGAEASQPPQHVPRRRAASYDTPRKKLAFSDRPDSREWLPPGFDSSAPKARQFSAGSTRARHDPTAPEKGLSSTEAYGRLFRVARKVLQEWREQSPSHFVWFVAPILDKSWWRWPTDFLAPLAGSAILLAVAVVVGVCAEYSDSATSSKHGKIELSIESAMLGLCAVLHVLTVQHERRLRNSELIDKLQLVVRKFRVLERNEVSIHHYADLKRLFPTSACDTISVWRNGMMVGVPAVLLVEGDVIALKPGDRSPAQVQLTEGELGGSPGSSTVTLDPGEAFLPEMVDNADYDNVNAQVVEPPRQYEFLVISGILETNLNVVYSRTLARRRTGLNTERIIYTIFLQRTAMVLWLLAVITNVCRLLLLPDDGGDWLEMVLLLPIHVILPFLPLAFPFMWIAANLYATAQVFAKLPFREASEQGTDATDGDDVVSIDSWESGSSISSLGDPNERTSRWLVLNYFLRGMYGSSGILTRTTNMVHTLGSVSVVCSIDKRGVLAQPMPGIETIFTFSDVTDADIEKRQNGDGDCADEDAGWGDDDVEDSGGDASIDNGVHHVVLDVLNHSGQYKPNNLRFVDPEWVRHLGSLKPLGMAMLLNSPCRNHTCGSGLADHLSEVESRVTGLPDKLLMASARVRTGPRCCTCRLAAELGFSQNAIENFQYRQALVTTSPFHESLLETDIAERGDPHTDETTHGAQGVEDADDVADRPPLKSRKLTPHVVSVIVHLEEQGSLQMFSCGTAELLVESCAELWDGQGIVPLGESERRRIIDFYNKTSTTMACYAFAYRPIYSQSNSKVDGPGMYFELAGNQAVRAYSVGERIQVSEDRGRQADLSELHAITRDARQMSLADLEVLADSASSAGYAPTPSMPLKIKPSSVLHTLTEEGLGPMRGRSASATQISPSPSSTSISLKDSVTEKYRALQMNQVFLGMVGVQDQALPDVDDMVEDLERAGIRFVYFSSEGAVDTKAFAEKIGLETGWNCHISLNSSGRSEYGVAESNARLPRGIDNIRRHIAEVDDVPLLVSLFSGCTPASTSDMIAIMQEHGKRVCCIGSSLNSFAAHAFAQCDMSISLDPLQITRCLTLGPSASSEFVIHGSAPEPLSTTVRRAETTAATVAAHFNTIPCSIGVHRDADMTLMKLIREARLYCLNVRQCFGFVAFTQCTLALLNLGSSLLLLPPIMGEGDLIWMCLVPVPILGFSLLGTPPEPRLERVFMSEVDIKTELWAKLKLYGWFLFWRGIPMTCALIYVFTTIMYEACQKESSDTDCHPLMGDRSSNANYWNGLQSGARGAALSLGQAVVCWLFVTYCSITSAMMLHRTIPFRACVNRVWVTGVCITTVLQTAYTTANIVLWGSSSVYSLTDIPIPAVCVASLFPFVIIGINELLRRKYASIDKKDQRWKKLKFTTKLGMHSPK